MSLVAWVPVGAAAVDEAAAGADGGETANGEADGDGSDGGDDGGNAAGWTLAVVAVLLAAGAGIAYRRRERDE